jgi:hypothetical protein
VSYDEYLHLSNTTRGNRLLAARNFDQFNTLYPAITYHPGTAFHNIGVKITQTVLKIGVPLVGTALVNAATKVSTALENQALVEHVAQQQAAAAQAPPAAAPAPDFPTSGPAYDFSNVISGGVTQVAGAPSVFRLDVEGKTVQDGVGSLAAINQIAYQNTQVGDRFEIFQNGQSIGLWIRTANGPIAVPANQAATVRAMSHADVLNLLSNASANAGGSSGGSGLLLLLAIPAIALAGSKKGR